MATTWAPSVSDDRSFVSFVEDADLTAFRGDVQQVRALVVGQHIRAVTRGLLR
jgi:hypothetical protein